MSKLLPKYSDEQIINIIRGESPWNLARREFSYTLARLEKASASPLEMRRIELDAIQNIAAILGVKELTP